MICIGSVLSVVEASKIQGVTQVNIVQAFLQNICPENGDVTKETANRIIHGKSNPSIYVMDAVTKMRPEEVMGVAKCIANSISSYLSENSKSVSVRALAQMIIDDTDILADTIVDLGRGVRKQDVITHLNEQEAELFFAGVFLYAIRNTDNRVKGIARKTALDYLEKVKNSTTSEGKSLIKNHRRESKEKDRSIDLVEENITKDAIAFCIKHDDQMDFLPLCGIVAVTDPTKKHCRELYDDFCMQTKSVQAKILEMKKVQPIVGIEDDLWWCDDIYKFQKDYSTYKLGAQRYAYTFSQYFPRITYHRSENIRPYMEHIFPRRIVNPVFMFGNGKLDIPGVIDEYLYYKDKEEKELVEPPMNYLWNVLRMADCQEKELTIELALFIIGFYFSKPNDNDNDMDAEEDYYTASLAEMETAEDLFYYTLSVLYQMYH